MWYIKTTIHNLHMLCILTPIWKYSRFYGPNNDHTKRNTHELPGIILCTKLSKAKFINQEKETRWIKSAIQYLTQHFNPTHMHVNQVLIHTTFTFLLIHSIYTTCQTCGKYYDIHWTKSFFTFSFTLKLLIKVCLP